VHSSSSEAVQVTEVAGTSRRVVSSSRRRLERLILMLSNKLQYNMRALSRDKYKPTKIYNEA
jgi:hypothetical protein